MVSKVKLTQFQTQAGTFVTNLRVRAWVRVWFKSCLYIHYLSLSCCVLNFDSAEIDERANRGAKLDVVRPMGLV